MHRLDPILALALAGWPAATTSAAAVALTVDGRQFSAASVTLKRGDRLLVANQSGDRPFIPIDTEQACMGHKLVEKTDHAYLVHGYFADGAR
jgi:hypothetical protein